MPRKPLTSKHNSPDWDPATLAAVNAQMGVVHRDDVGPTLGQLMALLGGPVFDPSLRQQWSEAMSAALGGESDAADYARPARTLRTAAITADLRRSQSTPGDASAKLSHAAWRRRQHVI